MDGSNKRKQVWENIFLLQTLETNEAQEIRQKLTSGNWSLERFLSREKGNEI